MENSIENSTKPEWTKIDSELATNEGWDLYHSEGSADGNRQVQRNDEQGLLNEDLDAWKIVKSNRQPHHSKALEILKIENINEYKRILNCK
jgi:hypothetical protein